MTNLVPNFTDKVNTWFDYGRTGGYLRHCLDRLQKFRARIRRNSGGGTADDPKSRIWFFHY